jgi:NADH-quinone oxidoreductase subunit H
MHYGDPIEIIRLLIKAFVIANLVMVTFAMMTWAERRLISFFQFRYGPNRVGPFGLLQPIADLLKLIRKENFQPGKVSTILHIAAPMSTLLFALGAFAVVPFGQGNVNLFGWHTPPSMAGNLSVGLLFAIAMSGLGGYGVIVGGWASNSKYALLGALRACAQLISYEVSLTLAVLPTVLMTRSLSMVDLANGSRAWSVWSWHPWFIVWMPFAFGIFCLAALAESNRAPFDHAEAEQELVAGFHTEFGGLRYALFANAEYIHMITICALGVVFFLGGWHGPGVNEGWTLGGYGIGWLIGVLWFGIKLALFMFLFIWIRATVPRLRYDRLMRLGWKILLPLATVQMLVIATVVTYPKQHGLQEGVVVGQWALIVLALIARSIQIRSGASKSARSGPGDLAVAARSGGAA